MAKKQKRKRPVVDGMKKHARVRQTTTIWYAFWRCPNPYGDGWVPLKTTHTHKMPSKVPCLFRREHAEHSFRNTKGANNG